MELAEVIKSRYSCRSYQSKLVEEDKLNSVLEAARLAPTAANRQPFKFIVIQTKGNEDDLRKIYNRRWFTQAPYVICGVGLHQKAWTRYDNKKYTLVDVAIAMDHLILTATSLGLGTCWIAAFNPDAAINFLGLPDEVEPIIFATLGYPADHPKPKERKPLAEITSYNHW